MIKACVCKLFKAATSNRQRLGEREREGEEGERGVTFSFAGQMKESREKAKGISLTLQLPGWGEGAAVAWVFSLIRTGEGAQGQQRLLELHKTVCLPLLSCERPHDSTSQHNIMAV